MKLIKAQVYDPYQDGVHNLPPRLELIITDQDLDTPTYEQIKYGWRITHFGKFLEFDRNEDNLEYLDEGDFNDDMALDEPVFPVTITVDGKMWTEMYMKVSKVRTILRKIGSAWECVPDPAWLQKHVHKWTLLNTDYVCQECKRESGDSGMVAATKGRRVQINESVTVTLCETHENEHNERYAAMRNRV